VIGHSSRKPVNKSPDVRIALILLALTPLLAQQPPYKDPSLATDRRVDDLLSHMTLEEKVSQMMNDSP
jgi:beta-glucosidase